MFLTIVSISLLSKKTSPDYTTFPVKNQKIIGNYSMLFQLIFLPPNLIVNKPNCFQNFATKVHRY